MRLTTNIRISMILLAVTVSLSHGEPQDRPVRYHPERLLVRFAPGTSKAARDTAYSSLEATELRSYKAFDGLVLVQVPEGEVLQKRVAFEGRGDVVGAHPDIELDFFGTTPSDCEFENQWALFNETTGFDIDAKDAWDLVRGDSKVRIAVIDDGVEYTHPDLKSKIWFNPEEDIEDPGEHVVNITDEEADPPTCPDPDLGICTNRTQCSMSAQNCNDQSDCVQFCCADPRPTLAEGCPPVDGDFDCCDNDGNGYIDDIVGYDCGDLDGNPFPLPGHRHGTLAAGTLAAATDNLQGIAGVNWNSELVILKVTTTNILTGTDEWRAWTSSAIEAMNYIIAEDIRVSNNSWGSPFASPDLLLAIENSRTQVTGGHVFVAAAGNATTDLDNVRECIGGSKDNEPCNVDAECLFCDDPVDDSCTTDDDCNPGGTCGQCRYNASRCVGGLNNNEMCSEDADCKFCTDPPGQQCNDDGNCDSGTCGTCPFKLGGRCFDGTNFDPPGCDEEADCDSGEVCIYVDILQCTGPPCGKRIYPCTWNIPNVICVASVAQNGGRLSTSNWGATRVDLGAPGENIPTTGRGHTYTTWAATSAAAPHVAGVVGLVVALHPHVPPDPPQEEQWGWSQVKDAVLRGVRPIPDLVDKTVTGGMLNALDALDGNSNGEIDRCEVANCPLQECEDWYGLTSCGTETDCADVGLPSDALPDCNDDGTADRCQSPFSHEDPEIRKNRYLTLVTTTDEDEVAVRVKQLSDPEWSHVRMWVGPQTAVTESSGQHDPAPLPAFTAARLETEPESILNVQWGPSESGKVIDVYGAQVIPGKHYQVQAVREACGDLGAAPLAYSQPLDIYTSSWGDVTRGYENGAWTPPGDGATFVDIGAIVNKFRNIKDPLAIRKARAELASAIHRADTGETDLIDFKVDFVDIGYAVDAFRGGGFPFVLPEPPEEPSCP